MLAVCAIVATACPAARVGARCVGNGWGHDSTHVLRCTSGRWRRAMTIGDYLRFVQEAQRRAAAEAERRASSAVRAASMRGTGAWVDVWDWSPTFLASRGSTASPGFTLARVHRMADAGISTLYIQTGRAGLPDAVLDPDLLRSIIATAKGRGMRVVAWYLPTFTDPNDDLAKLAGAATLDIDGIGVDIESTATALGDRNPRLIVLSAWLRQTYPGMPLAAIVLPPVVTDVLNTAYWPDFPWQQLAPYYDVWMPMSYWTNRTPQSGWRDGYRYTAENIDRLRAHLGDPAAAVHPVGGESNAATPDEIRGFVWAAQERGAIGGGLYDDMISTPEQYALLAPLARP